MDQSALVEATVNDGRRIVERFAADGNPVIAAYWAKSEETGERWYLYIATEIVDLRGDAAAGAALRVALAKLGRMWVSDDEVRVTGWRDPVVKEVVEVMIGPYPVPDEGGFRTLKSLGHESAYIYSPRVFTFIQTDPMTAEDVGREIVRLMSRGNSLPSRVGLKDGTAFNGTPFALQLGGQNALVAQFVAEGEYAPRVVRVDEIASVG